MSAIENIHCMYDDEVKKRGSKPEDGLEIGVWARIIREGIKGYKGTDADIAEAFLQADTNKDNVLTYDEFYTCMTKPHLDEKKMKEVDETFKSWDKSGDCKLTKEEISQAVGKYRPETIQRIFDDADKNGDGFVSVDEFKLGLFGKK